VALHPAAAALTVDWRLRGSYLEACNCEVICPCRRVGGREGGRSTYGVCEGALSWAIEDGLCGDVDLSGLAAVLACRYEDDEPGSPWTVFLYVDERGDRAQREALASILTGELGGTPARQFPWVWKERHLLGWRAAPIEVKHARRGWFKAGGAVTLRVGDAVAHEEPVTCGIPGHHRSGEELHAELLRVDEGPLSFEVTGRCAYKASFEYSSAGARC
jgi:hypothetical protein